MAWRLRQKLKKAPAGHELIRDKLDEFEARMREVTSAPRGEAMNHELSWPVHRLHYEKNRYLHDMRYVHNAISDDLLRYLVKERVADGPLIAKWRKPGYETLCSLAVITRSNTNFGTVGICRTPLRDRTGQIMPNVITGCVCCVSGRAGPIWWNDPVPDVVQERLLSIDPGKAALLEEMETAINDDDVHNVDGVHGAQHETAEVARGHDEITPEIEQTGANDECSDTVENLRIGRDGQLNAGNDDERSSSQEHTSENESPGDFDANTQIPACPVNGENAQVHGNNEEPGSKDPEQSHIVAGRSVDEPEDLVSSSDGRGQKRCMSDDERSDDADDDDMREAVKKSRKSG